MDSAVCGKKSSSSAGDIYRSKQERYVLGTNKTYGILRKLNWRMTGLSLMEVGILEVKEAFSSLPGMTGQKEWARAFFSWYKSIVPHWG